MDTSADSKNAPKKPAPVSSLQRGLELLAFPVAGISGFWAVYNSIRSSVKNTAKEFGLFDKLDAELKPNSIKTHTTPIGSTFPKEQFIREDRVNHKVYTKGVANILEERGLGPLNFKTRWDYVSSIAHQHALVDGMTVAGVAVGAILTIADNKWLMSHFGGDKTNNDISR